MIKQQRPDTASERFGRCVRGPNYYFSCLLSFNFPCSHRLGLKLKNGYGVREELPYLKKRVTKVVVFLYRLWLDDGEKEVA